VSQSSARFASVRLRPRQAYAFAVASTAISLAIRLLFPRAFGPQPPVIIFSLAIMLTAYLGGLRAGLVATTLAYLAAIYLLSPLVTSSPAPSQAILVVITGAFISIVGETLHRTRRRGNAVIEQHRLGANALRQSEERYDDLIDWSPEPIIIQREGRILFANPAAVAMFGAHDTGAVVGGNIREFLHGDSLPLALRRIDGPGAGPRFLPLIEMDGVRPDGTSFGLEVQGRSIDIDGEAALLTSLRDISVRQAHEVEIGRLNRMYAALSEINQAIVRMPTRDELFSSVCRTLVDHGGVRAAWIRWDLGSTRKLAAVAMAAGADGAPAPARSGFDEVSGCYEPGATAFREGRTILQKDMRELRGTPAWTDAVVRSGLQECAAFPIRENGVVRGTLTVATHERGFFQVKEIALLEEVSRDVSFALDMNLREHRRKEADDALLLERDRFRRLFDYAPVGIIIADPSGRYLEVNQAMRGMVGYSRDELVGHDASLIVAPEEIRHIEQAVITINAKADYCREWRFRRKDGSQFTGEVNSIALPDRNLLATIRDVTERNDASQAVRVAEERMRFALEASKVGIWDLDYTTGVLEWSETLEAQYGLEPHSFGGTVDAFLDRVHPDDRGGVVGTMEKAVTSGRDFTVQNRALWTDGTVRYLHGAGRIVLDEHGKPMRGVGISMDVSSQRSLEEQFQQSQKMESMGRLAGGVAHDFNNLLTIILGYCELIKMDLGPGARQGADLAEIEHAGRSAAELTRQLLAFSRKQVIAPTQVELSDEVRTVAVMLRRLLGDHVRIALDLDTHLGIISADRAQIEQVIVNLAVNARDAMPTGGTLTIATSNVTLDDEYATLHLGILPGHYVKLAVTDTGCGMTPEVQARLFEPFFTTKEVGKGTGLGLATVHGIVARSGGSITVESTVNLGTTIKVFFPVDESADKVVPPAERHADAPVTGRTLLVVDDARSLRVLTKRLAESLGYVVLLAANADEALRAVGEHPEIDLVLTDVVMPGWSGLDLSRRIREQRPDIRVVLMSGYADDAISQHGVLSADIPLLNKPFTSEMLAEKLREAFEP
jgi:two-component system cell cycle sensor histidine kinase/response regulator CckA